MTAPAALTTTTRPHRWLTAFVPDDSRRGRINAAAFAAAVYFGLSFALAPVLPGATLLVGQVAAMVIATFAAGRLVGAHGGRSWLLTIGWILVTMIVLTALIGAAFAFLAWGPPAP